MQTNATSTSGLVEDMEGKPSVSLTAEELQARQTMHPDSSMSASIFKTNRFLIESWPFDVQTSATGGRPRDTSPSLHAACCPAEETAKSRIGASNDDCGSFSPAVPSPPSPRATACLVSARNSPTFAFSPAEPKRCGGKK